MALTNAMRIEDFRSSVSRVFVGFALVVFQGCTTSPASEVTVVSYTRYGHGSLPSYRTHIYSDRRVVYEGINSVKVLGKREFALSETQYRDLLKAFEEAGFQGMPAIHGPEMPLDIVVSITLNQERQSKTVVGTSIPMGWSRGLALLVRRIEEVVPLSQFVCPSIREIGGSSVDLCDVRKNIEEAAFPRSEK